MDLVNYLKYTRKHSQFVGMENRERGGESGDMHLYGGFESSQLIFSIFAIFAMYVTSTHRHFVPVHNPYTHNHNNANKRFRVPELMLFAASCVHFFCDLDYFKTSWPWLYVVIKSSAFKRLRQLSIYMHNRSYTIKTNTHFQTNLHTARGENDWIKTQKRYKCAPGLFSDEKIEFN